MNTRMTDMEIIRGHDTGDWCDVLWANALTRTGLGSAAAPEPVKPSRPFGCHPISQEKQERGGQSNKRAPRNHGQ